MFAFQEVLVPGANSGFESTTQFKMSDVARLKSQIIGGFERRIAFGGHANLDAHFENLRLEFTGLPALCFAHAQLNVLIRRRIDIEENVPLFFELWAAEAEFLCKYLSSRWLISACDSFADYGSGRQRTAAMMLVVLINMTKLAETERVSLKDRTSLEPDYAEIVECYDRKQSFELWDGIVAYSPYNGDMPRNMFRRVMKLTDSDPALRLIARTLIRRAVEADTLLGRLARLNPEFLPIELRAPIEAPPLAPDR
jgi:hypothetical protein